MKTEKLDFYGKTYQFIFTNKESEFLPLIQKLDSRPKDYLFGIDIETAPEDHYKNIIKAGLNPRISKPRTIQIATESSVVVFDVKDANLGIFKTFLESRRFVAHFAVFEIQFFARHIIKQRPNIDCTLLLSKLLLHASRPFDNASLSLDALTKSLLGIELPKGNQTSDWTGKLTWEQVLYAGTDGCRALEGEKYID
jgi:ribonuclease D